MTIGTGGKAVIASLLVTAALLGCGGEDSPTGPPTSITETYTVLSDSQWTVIETSYGVADGWVAFQKTSTGVSFGNWRTAGSQLLAITTNVLNPGLTDETWLLKFPLAPGGTWTAAGTSNGMVVTSSTHVNEMSVPVTVAAGTFLCALTTETITLPTGYDKTGQALIEHKRYFAPGVGLVKVQAKRLNGSVITGELQSYSVAESESADYFPLADNDSWTFKWTGM